MIRWLLPLLLTVSALRAAELNISFADATPGQPPAGFTNLLFGTGAPGDWRIVLDDVPPVLAPLTEQAPTVTRRPVLAQVAPDPTDERFPMLAYQGEVFGDFRLTTRFKIIGGEKEQMAGIAFRLLNETNFYVIRASALGRNLRFYKVVNGMRGPAIGPTVDIPTNVWQELTIECRGTVIRAALNGRPILPELNDSSFSAGRIAFWTKSDSQVRFADARISYTPRVPLAQKMVANVMARQPRILLLRVYTAGEDGEPRVAGSSEESELGQPGGKYEKETLATGKIFAARNKEHAAVVMPLRDRNGDVAGAVRLHLTTFPGQTEQNVLARATPIVKMLQAQVQSAADLRP